jgi:hypothetical protein
MRVPAKYLFYDGLPNAKDIDKIMADNGYQSPTLPQVDTSNYHPIDDLQVQNSVGPAPTQGMNLQFNRPQPQQHSDPNNLGNYINAGLGIADSLIPGERIHRNYPTEPLPTYNPYQYGTGSSAIMEHGGSVEYGYKHDFKQQYADGGNVYGRIAAGEYPMAPSGPAPVMLESYDKIAAENGMMLPSNLFKALGMLQKSSNDDNDSDDAASGIHIKPSHKGRFTAFKKRTGETTEEALHSKNPHVRKMANFAKNAKKWKHGENGIELESYDKADAFDGISLYPYDIEMAAAGASLTSGKAKEILRDGTANGHPLTPKQKRFMGWKAGGSADYGNSTNVYDQQPNPVPGPGPKAPPGMQQTGTLAATPQSRTDAYLLDDINQTLATGVRSKNNGYAPEQQKMLNDAYIWRQANGQHNNPQQNMEGYFNQTVDPNNPMHMYRAKLSKIGYGPGAMYNTTPNEDVRNPSPVVKPAPSVASTATSMADGGFVEGSIHDLPEEQIASMLKKGYRFEHFKD